jgi:hypothetical protein
MSGTKDEALSYLKDLEKTLSASGMPNGSDMNVELRKIVADAMTDKTKKHLRSPEAAFLNTYVIRQVFNHLQKAGGLNPAQAREALLNEYHKTMPDIAKGGVGHPLRHPFNKATATSAESTYKNWLTPKNGDGLTKSYPDFAVRDPFPHRILFEGKFFAKDAPSTAQRELASDLYQTFFYLGLPRAKTEKKGQSDWHYDYACLLAFDGSKDGTLLDAWKALSPTIRKSFWESANIYVMILRD